MDMDLYIMLYERLPSGDFIRLFNPAYEFRASYARDRVHRHLLKAGERQELSFRSERMMSRQLGTGSLLVMVLGINKPPDREINYGTGNDVSEETIADGRIPSDLLHTIATYRYAGSQVDPGASQAAPAVPSRRQVAA